jgi:hypothetical protein
VCLLNATCSTTTSHLLLLLLLLLLCLQDEQQRPAVHEVDPAALGEEEEGVTLKCARCYSLVHYGCVVAVVVMVVDHSRLATAAAAVAATSAVMCYSLVHYGCVVRAGG